MSTNSTAAYGMYPREAVLPEIVSALRQAGLDKREICMVLSPAHPDATAVRETGDYGRDQSAKKSARTIGWFSEFGAVVIPTVGVFIRSQEFFRALLQDENTPSLSQVQRTLLGLGFSPEQAKRLHRQLCDFGTLLFVTCKESSKTNSIIDILRNTGAREAASLESLKAAVVA